MRRALVFDSTVLHPIHQTCRVRSAGVGRTGTFIAVDRLLQQLANEQPPPPRLNLFSVVMELRRNRVLMVQTEDQFVYVHECVRDAILQRGSVDNQGTLSDTYVLYCPVVYCTDELQCCVRIGLDLISL